MVRRVDTAEVRQLAGDGAQLVEVLPASAYAREHLPGAVNIPLPDLDERTAATLDRNRPVVVYCYDTECDLSARGAALLERLGFADVLDYTASKTAWLAMNLPSEGTIPASARAGAIARRDVPTCPATATVGDLTGSDGARVVVLDEGDVVVGELHPEARALPAATSVLDAMQPAPSTVRPSVTADELAESMDRDGQDHVLVTCLDGTFVGVIGRADLAVDA